MDWRGGACSGGRRAAGAPDGRGTSDLAWLYLWKDGNATCRRLKKPDGTESLEMTVSADLVQVSGTLTKTNRLSDVMRRRMDDLGII